MTIENETVATLFRHNLWANVRLFEVCAHLSDEQLDASVTGGYGSIRDTMQHIVTAERSYLQRITTGQPYRRPQGAPLLTMAEMQDSIRTSGEGFIVAAPNVQVQDSVTVDREGTPRSVPSTILLTQAINHATEHRAQITAVLTHLGVEPPSLDGWTYFDSSDS